MEGEVRKDDTHWDHFIESFDLLYAHMGEMAHNQHLLAAQIDVSVLVIEQVLMDQTTLTKKMETTGQAVAQLNLLQKEHA